MPENRQRIVDRWTDRTPTHRNSKRLGNPTEVSIRMCFHESRDRSLNRNRIEGGDGFKNWSDLGQELEPRGLTLEHRLPNRLGNRPLDLIIRRD